RLFQESKSRSDLSSNTADAIKSSVSNPRLYQPGYSNDSISDRLKHVKRCFVATRNISSTLKIWFLLAISAVSSKARNNGTILSIRRLQLSWKPDERSKQFMIGDSYMGTDVELQRCDTTIILCDAPRGNIANTRHTYQIG